MPDPVEHLPVSWAEQWEDVRLWRVLRDRSPGFYVDVGAMDPSEDSVTRAFYDRGWWGLDVEANPFYVKRLIDARPRDRVEGVAAGLERGTATLHVVRSAGDEETGLTTLEDGVAARHAGEGSRVVDVEVDVVPLSELLDGSDAADPVRFHFLKVDVEGHEAAVLAGADLRRFRPLVVSIEARAPRRPVDTYAESESILIDAGYVFAADDGLNRWYVRSEDADVAALLAPEINPLLDGQPRRWWEMARERELSDRMDELDGAARAASAEATALRTEVADLRSRLDTVYRSRTWRATAPLRALARTFRRSPP
jgi:FkbM family methyltransferase